MSEEQISTPIPGTAASASDGKVGSFRTHALKASVFTVGGYGASQLLRIGSNMALTRMLFPEAFGLMALVQVILTGLEMLSDVGIQPSIVQNEKGDDPDFLNTAWTIQVIRGFSLWACGVVIGFAFAWLYGHPELVQLVPAAAAAAALAGLNSTKLATLNRRMDVAPMVLIDLLAQVCAIAVMLSLALVYRSVWALVAGGVASALIRMLLSHLVLSGIRNRFRWDAEAVSEIVHFGKWIFLSTTVTFLALRFDILLLGSLLSVDLLGVYSVAGLLAVLPQQLVARLMMFVLFPALSAAARASREQFSARLRRARSVLLPASLFIVLGIALLAPAFFRYLYDERYHGAGWMARLLMIAVWFQLLHTIAARVMLAIGDSRSLAISNVLRLAFTATCCLVGFNLAELTGFILGAGAGAFMGYAVLVVAMLGHRLKVGREDLAYSAVGLLCGVVGVYGPQVLAPSLGWREPGLLEFGFAALILVPLGLLVLRRARQFLDSDAA